MLSSLMVKIVGLLFLVLAYNKVSLRDQPNHVTQNTQILDNCVSEVVLEKEKKKFLLFLGFFSFYSTKLFYYHITATYILLL